MKKFLVYLSIVPLFFIFACDGGGSLSLLDDPSGSPSSSSNDTTCKDKVLIDTTTGSFCAASDSPKDVNAYRGIKYAKGGESYRWQSPVTTDDSTTAKEADTFGDICAQADLSMQEMGTLYTDNSSSTPISVKGSEDCLYLNIYTPKELSDEKKSVIVWIHGGAFLLGSGSNVIF